jgi:integrase
MEYFNRGNEGKEKHKNIKNALYRQFLDKGIIELIKEEDITLVLNAITGAHAREARALIITLYYTGGRTNEILRLKSKDFTREGGYLIIDLPSSKNGLPRKVYLPLKKLLVKELLKYSLGIMPEAFIFYNYKGEYHRRRIDKRGNIRERIEYSDKLRYHFSKWFSVLPVGSITPYYLRHNRFSKLSMAGATMEQLRLIKGAKTYNSIMPYIHMSTAMAKDVARKLD